MIPFILFYFYLLLVLVVGLMANKVAERSCYLKYDQY